MKTDYIKLITLLLLLFFSVNSYAQNSGKISGKVTDAVTNEPVVGANIIIEGTSTGSATDLDGEYIIVNVPPGTYNVSASYIGYAKTTTQNVKVLTDLTTTINFKLSESAVTLGDEVIVVAEAPLVIKDLTATESRVTSEEIEAMPLQSLDQLITLQAGVSKDANGDIHIRGGRSSEISYLVNGVSITDDYDHSRAITVETSSVQELQVISGSFNAEYGNALSGVVNTVTKTGGSIFKSSFEVWTGDYLSSNTSIFMNINDFKPNANYNIQGTVSGPILGEDLTYFFTARRFSNAGYIYGQNKYLPQGRFRFEGFDLVPNPGDDTYVSMNSSDRWSGQGTLNWKISSDFNFKLDLFGSTEQNRMYNHLYTYNPYGANRNKSNGYTALGTLTHVLFLNTFQELTVAYKYNDYRTRLYEDPFDPRYASPDSNNIPGFHFQTSGNDLNRFYRDTKSLIAKWSVTSQVNKTNLAKAGIEFQSDKLYYENITLIPAKLPNGQNVFPFRTAIAGIESPQHSLFERTPYKLSAYIQDKLEFESFILNIGLRFDMFDSRGKLPVDPEDPNIYTPRKPSHIYKDNNNNGIIEEDESVETNKYTVEERKAFWYKNTSVKTQLSPRIGIAYPITEEGIIRFSYGIFQQVPDYSQLYIGDEYKLTEEQGMQGPFGNPDLNPQRTIIYEIGLQQQVSDNFAFDITAFYRDIRDWISSSQAIPTFLAGISYSKRINRDFANVKGVTLSVNKRFSDNYSFGIDYTFQVAEGTNSSPDQEFFALQNGSQPTRYLTPLDWDQLHTLNGSFYYGGETWGVSLIGSVNTGQPYTPTRIEGSNTGSNVLSGLAANSRRKPVIANVDLEVHRDFDFDFMGLQLFVKVFNLLDLKNPVNVFGDTGKPDYTLQLQTVTAHDADWFVYPTFYSAPRSIYFGTNITLK